MSSVVTTSVIASVTTDQSHTSMGVNTTWSNGSYILANVGSVKAAITVSTPTLTGSSVWTQIGTAVTSTAIRRITPFWTVGDGSTSTVTIDYGGVAHTNSLFACFTLIGNVSLATNIQSGTTTATSSVMTHTELSSLSSTNNPTFAALIRAATNGITAGSGYTNLGGNTSTARIYMLLGNTNQPDCTMATSVQWASVGWEQGMDASAVVVGQSTLQRSAQRRRR